MSKQALYSLSVKIGIYEFQENFLRYQCFFVNQLENNSVSGNNEKVEYHGTIIWTGITCKKIPCYMHDSACRLFIVKKAKMLWSMLNIFKLSQVWKNVESWLVYANKLFWNCPTMFLDWHNNTKLLAASFFAFETFNEKKNMKFLIQC